MLRKSEAIDQLNSFGKNEIPFIFYDDFLGEKWNITPISELNSKESFYLEIENKYKLESIKYRVESTRYKVESTKYKEVSLLDGALKRHPITFGDFKKSFDQVVRQINIGNSFLTNLTFQTPIETDLSLEEIFRLSRAKYKLYVPNKFVVFSPETFVKTKNNLIYSYPMKGTIDADIPNAREVILNDPKEKAEHITIVDLIRNDLSQVAQNVSVSKFRYIEELKTQDKNLLQVSSEVFGELETNWKHNLGNILCRLLPAGSISGAPKPETLNIIQKVENYDRGFYTGICGYFDGENLDTGVMIRFIKKGPSRAGNYPRESMNQLYYCSGGGITSFSNARKEYQEMIDKIYLPVH